MGLDMYLARRVYVGAEYENRNVTAKIEIWAEGRKLNIDPKKISYIEERIGYWRKANSIHSWFVENVQDGEDDCGTYYVSEEKLKELKELCDKILNSTKLIPGKVWNGYSLVGGERVDHWEDGKILENDTFAQEFLPTQDGFFFGSTEYDEYYWQDLLDTKEICEYALSVYDSDSEIYYHSSW